MNVKFIYIINIFLSYDYVYNINHYNKYYIYLNYFNNHNLLFYLLVYINIKIDDKYYH